MTTSINPTLTQAQHQFKILVWDPLIMTGEAALFAEFPILAAPVLGQIDKEIISLISDDLFARISLLLDVASIKWINAAHQEAYESASENLVIISQEKGVSSAEYQAALTKASDDFVKFVRFTAQ